MQNGSEPHSRLERLEAMLTSHAEMLNKLAPLMAQVAQIATTTSETVTRHDEVLTRLEQQTLQNTKAIAQMSEQLQAGFSDVISVIKSLANDIEANTQAIAQQRADFEADSRRVWEYLLQQSGNGNGGSSS